jgi:hypothetical protein
LLDPSQPFDPRGKCPEYEIPEAIAVAASEKRKADDREMAFLSKILPAAPITTGRDGGTHQAFSAPPDSTARLAISRPAPGPEVVTGSTQQTRAVPTPQSNPRRNEPMAASINGSSRNRTQPAGVPAPRPQPATESEPQQNSAPQALPGATPIRASGGGFSFR